ncbi:MULTISPECIES: 3-keto-5-aminohexanoate cleavage protein [Cohaesibacter]|uniref:3-keto-5-aminohexanoate cleavage protein n=1 Tax=Cohaesibacter TaxID=655352 RepID=UPI000DEBA8A7|nr:MULTISPECIES: 3-keto-5-aminohexanoate cleavage protein [Cohaesibacter]TLP43836.1 3-keto-5-aminohexanoate cleavage protein [Cohaesibacter sp. CAU 1516]
MFFGMPKPVVLSYAANGIRRSKRDCLALPIKPDELVASARAAKEAGASLYSFSVRDDTGIAMSQLDALLPTIAMIRDATDGGFGLQLELDINPATGIDLTEVDRLLAAETVDSLQIRLDQILPRDGDEADEDRARQFLDLCNERGTGVQFALDRASDIEWFYAFRQYGIIPESCRALLFILGTDGEQPTSNANELRPFLTTLDKLYLTGKVAWSVAAFGPSELTAQTAALAMGGHMMMGPAYNAQSGQGEAFKGPQDQVSPLQQVANLLGRSIASGFETRTLLFGPR